jgi:hypothetical protein
MGRLRVDLIEIISGHLASHLATWPSTWLDTFYRKIFAGHQPSGQFRYDIAVTK